jgi:hypothetical protein
MANPKIKDVGKETRFKPGQVTNPGGKPVGARNALQGDFMRELAKDFAEHGVSAIVETRTTQPAQYMKIIASLMPKELEIKRPLEEMTDDDLIAGVAALQSYLNAGSTSKGVGDTAKPEQAKRLPSLH